VIAGVFGKGKVEIISGLKEGEAVILDPPAGLADEHEVKVIR
jgi:hypothetical protein